MRRMGSVLGTQIKGSNIQYAQSFSIQRQRPQLVGALVSAHVPADLPCVTCSMRLIAVCIIIGGKLTCQACNRALVRPHGLNRPV